MDLLVHILRRAYMDTIEDPTDKDEEWREARIQHLISRLPIVRCDLEAGEYDVPCERAFGGAHDIFAHLRDHLHAYPILIDAPLVEFPEAPTETILTYDQVWVGLPRLPQIAIRPDKAAVMEFYTDKYTGPPKPRSIFYHDEYE
ncbi:hypothetical protein Aduo_018847 [Ancylostoma duodenale]